MKVPIDPAADIVPIVTLRLRADTARADAARARLSPVQASANPTMTPSPIQRAIGPSAIMVTPSPAAYSREPKIHIIRQPNRSANAPINGWVSPQVKF